MSTNIQGLNYADMGISGTKQLGSNTKVQDETKMDYTDGLSKKELETIDTNKDGVITEQEFRKACQSEGLNEAAMKNHWETLTLFTKAVATKTASDGSIVTQKNGQKNIKTTFDASGNVLEKSVTSADGSKITSIYKDGKLSIINKFDKAGKQTVSEEYNTTGLLTKKTTAGGTQITYSYDSNGKKTNRTSLNTNGSKEVTEYQDNKTIETKYGKNGQQLSKIVTKKDGNSVKKEYYNSNNEITSYTISVTANNGDVTITSYNSQDKVTQVKGISTNEKGIKTEVTMNASLHVLSTERFDGNGKKITLADTINGKLDEKTSQGYTGDCWFIAGLNSLNSTPKGREIIQNSIQKNSDGSVTVNFKGLGRSYTLTEKEINKYDTDTITSDAYSNGDNDLLVLELAYEQIRQKRYGVEMDYGGNSRELLKALTGQKTTAFYDNNYKTTGADIDKALNAALKNGNLALSFSLREGHHEAKQTDGTTYPFDLPAGAGHAFSITNVTQDTVTFVNPWDSNAPITMTRAEFKKLGISGLSGVDLSNTNPQNIQPLSEASEDELKWQAGQIMIGDFDIKESVVSELTAKLKETLKNGSIKDVDTFYQNFIKNKNYDSETKSNISSFLKTTAMDKKLDYADIGKVILACSILSKANSTPGEFKSIIELLKNDGTVSQMFTQIDNLGFGNPAEIKDYLLMFDRDKDGKISEDEYTKRGMEFLDVM